MSSVKVNFRRFWDVRCVLKFVFKEVVTRSPQPLLDRTHDYRSCTFVCQFFFQEFFGKLPLFANFWQTKVFSRFFFANIDRLAELLGVRSFCHFVPLKFDPGWTNASDDLKRRITSTVLTSNGCIETYIVYKIPYLYPNFEVSQSNGEILVQILFFVSFK